MSVIPCYRGGHHCTWPACSLGCDGRPGSEPDKAIIDGTHYVKNIYGRWAPDYSVPGTAERINMTLTGVLIDGNRRSDP
jgi:hypothetical protein